MPRSTITPLRPPVWAGEDVAGLVPSIAEFQAWRRQCLRAARVGDDVGRKRARAALRDAREEAAAALEQPHLRRAWQAVEYTEECLVQERLGESEEPHDPSLCYLCDPGATIGLTLPRAVGYATAALFQVENGEEADDEFLADWNEFRRGRGVRAIPPAQLASSAEARDDLRAFLAWELEGICLDYPMVHLRRWLPTRLGREAQGASERPLSRTALDAIVTRVTTEAERYWLFGKTCKNGFSSTRL